MPYGFASGFPELSALSRSTVMLSP